MNKKSNKIVLLICVLMMIMPFFTFNVGAWSLEDTVRWDLFTVGRTNGASGLYFWITTEGDSGDVKLESVNTSTKSLYQSAGYPYASGYDNDITKIYLDYDMYTNVSGIEFWFKFMTLASAGADYSNLQYDFYRGTTLKSSVRINTGGSDIRIQVLDANETWNTLESGFTGYQWYTRSLKITYDSESEYGDILDYTLRDDDNTIIKTEMITICELGGNFDWINEIHISSAVYGTYYQKKIFSYTGNFAFDQTGYAPPEIEEFEFESTDNIGNLDTTCFDTLYNKELEFHYRVPITINATGFDLLVDRDMFLYDHNLLNYDLYINGESMGHPSEWKEYSSNYVLRWNFSTPKAIVNSEVLYELWHDVRVPNGYWSVGVGCNYANMDFDGFIQLKHSDTYPNGVYDGTIRVSDVAYQLYYDNFSFIEDAIDITYDSITTIEGSYYVGDSIPLTYMLQTSNMIYDNYVKIWNDDTSTEITIDSLQGFPYLCTYQLETIGFVPFVSANYTAELYINGANVTNVSFFVNDRPNSDMYVFTYPNPSKVGEEIRVEYNFDHPSDKDGAIFLCSLPNLNSYISVNFLSDGDSGFWTETHNTEGNYYYILAVDIDGNGTYGIVSNGIHKHIVVREQGNNYFKLGSYNLRLDVEGIVTQTVTGESSMIFGNCFIYDNNRLIKTITDSPFSYSYDIYTAGMHTVEMRLITNVTTILFWENYTVSTFTGEDVEDEVEDTGYIVHDWLYEMYGDIGLFLGGICVVLGFMFIPFALVLGVNVKYNKNIALGDLHWSVYLIFAIVGVIVDVQLHLAELWIILLVCVVSIAIAVITWNGNR